MGISLGGMMAVGGWSNPLKRLPREAGGRHQPRRKINFEKVIKNFIQKVKYKENIHTPAKRNQRNIVGCNSEHSVLIRRLIN